MPLVLLQYDGDRRTSSFIAVELARHLPEIVARALDISESAGDAGRLVPDDIEVWCQEFGKFDVNVKDFKIVIWAHDFPAQRFNFKQRGEEIAKNAREFISNRQKELGDHRKLSGFVWLLLQPSVFCPL